MIVNMEDKYNMTQEQNVFFAKRNVVDSIWKSSHIEGIDVTYLETQKVYDGGNVAHLRIDEIQTINNLKHVWLFILNSINTENNIILLKSINSIVGSNLVDRAGNMRTYDVNIGGTTWKPRLPNEDILENELKKFESIECITERAIIIMCHLMRTQFFSDGNKRTAMLFANKILIENGKGIISIPIDKDVEFGELLIKYYETNNYNNLKCWIYDNALNGINYEEEK